MKIAFRKTSLVDYPGKVSAVIFFPFCDLRCPWCHNGELVLRGSNAAGLIELDEALHVIEKRRNVIAGVVLSGGEPTLYTSLNTLIPQIKALGLAVKLDTNGLHPDVLETLLACADTRPDFIAMDLKIAPARYKELLPPCTLHPAPSTLLTRSAEIISKSGIPHEFRSLNLPEWYFGEKDKDA